MDVLEAEITEDSTATQTEGCKVTEPGSLSGWVKKLGDSGMPVFANTARELGRISRSKESNAAELARVVLQDAAMTARLLRVANSPIFNPMRSSISTVSRAVIVLGFDEVRSICMSIAIVETMTKGRQRQRVIEEMAKSFHAAVQARCFAKKHKDSSPEEVFIATLLYRLGDLAFWAFAGDSAQKLDAAIQQREPSGEKLQKIQHEVLGFALQDLTLGLSKEWNLGELLDQSLRGESNKNPRANNVMLGCELAATAANGWDAPGVTTLLKRIAENLYLPLEEVVDMVKNNAREAAEAAAMYGAASAGEHIPVTGKKSSKSGSGENEKNGAGEQKFLEPDAMLQLNILRELSTLMDDKPNFNLILEMVLEGIYRGIGMDRTLFALRTPDHRFVMGRYALGTDHEALRTQFQIETVVGKTNLLTSILDSKQSVWVGGDKHSDVDSRLLTPEILAITKGSPFFITPIEIRGKVLGIFYADRQPSGRPLDKESFNNFKHFAQQGNLALTYLNS